jgi:hypothetical protein
MCWDSTLIGLPSLSSKHMKLWLEVDAMIMLFDSSMEKMCALLVLDIS